jgi:hypothetical protein
MDPAPRRHKRKLRRKQTTTAQPAQAWQALPLATWVQDYLRWAEVSRLSETSVRQRERSLARFITWAHERGLRHPREFSRAILEASAPVPGAQARRSPLEPAQPADPDRGAAGLVQVADKGRAHPGEPGG